MTSGSGKDAKSLVSSILGSKSAASATPASTPESEPPAAAPSADDEPDPGPSLNPPATAQGLRECIVGYFNAEGPEDREQRFEQIAGCRLPEVKDFLAMMLEQDSDDYMRVDAASELLKRNDQRGEAYLQGRLEDAQEDPQVFEAALLGLIEVQGAAAFERLATLLKGDLELGKRLVVVENLADTDPDRALAHFVKRVEGITSFDNFPDEELERIVLAFTRLEHRPGGEALQGLLGRLRQANVDPDDRAEWEGLLTQGAALIAGR